MKCSGFPVFTSKIATIPNFEELPRTSHTTEKNFGCRSKRKKKFAFSLLQFYNAAKAAEKRLFKQTEHLHLNNLQTWLLKSFVFFCSLFSFFFLRFWFPG